MTFLLAGALQCGDPASQDYAHNCANASAFGATRGPVPPAPNRQQISFNFRPCPRLLAHSKVDDPRAKGSIAALSWTLVMIDANDPAHGVATQQASAPASPCVGVCQLDAQQVCIGCGRHVIEITAAGVEAARVRWADLQKS